MKKIQFLLTGICFSLAIVSAVIAVTCVINYIALPVALISAMCGLALRGTV